MRTRRDQALNLVVMVQAFSRDDVQPSDAPEDHGSGIVVGVDFNQLYVLTASHVVHNTEGKLAKRVDVTFYNPRRDHNDSHFRFKAESVGECRPAGSGKLDDWWVLKVEPNEITPPTVVSILGATDHHLRPRALTTQSTNGNAEQPPFFGAVSVIGWAYDRPWSEAEGQVDSLKDGEINFTGQVDSGFSGGGVFDDDGRLVGMFRSGVEIGRGDQHAILLDQFPFGWLGDNDSKGAGTPGCKGLATLRERLTTEADDVATRYEESWAQANDKGDVSVLQALFPTLPNANRLKETLKQNKAKATTTVINPNCQPANRTSSVEAYVECTATRQFKPKEGLSNQQTGCVCLNDHFWLVKRSEGWVINRWEGDLCSDPHSTAVKK